MMSIVQHDPGVQSVVGYTGSGSGGGGCQTNTASVYVSLKPLNERDSVTVVMNRLRRKLVAHTGRRLFLKHSRTSASADGQSNAEYQYTVLGDTTAEVYQWTPKLMAAMQKDPTFLDVNSDQQQGGGRDGARPSIATPLRGSDLTLYQIDNTLYDAFGQRSVSTIYNALNQYHVVMEVAPKYWQRPVDARSNLGQHVGRAARRLGLDAARRGAVTRRPPGPAPAAISPAAQGDTVVGSRIARPTAQRFRRRTPTSLLATTSVVRTTANANVLDRAGRPPRPAQVRQRSRPPPTMPCARRAGDDRATARQASSASPVSTAVETMTPLPAIANMARATRRSRSIIRTNTWRRQSLSISRPESR